MPRSRLTQRGMRGSLTIQLHRLIGGLMVLGAWSRVVRGPGDDVARGGLWGDRGVQDPGELGVTAALDGYRLGHSYISCMWPRALGFNCLCLSELLQRNIPL
jgi:hypothetical protein